MKSAVRRWCCGFLLISSKTVAGVFKKSIVTQLSKKVSHLLQFVVRMDYASSGRRYQVYVLAHKSWFKYDTAVACMLCGKLTLD